MEYQVLVTRADAYAALAELVKSAFSLEPGETVEVEITGTDYVELGRPCADFSFKAVAERVHGGVNVVLFPIGQTPFTRQQISAMVGLMGFPSSYLGKERMAFLVMNQSS